MHRGMTATRTSKGRMHGFGVRLGTVLLGLACPLTPSLAAGQADAPIATRTSTAELKKLTLDELLDVAVTSISRRPEPLSKTASAIQVVTAEDIRRAGVTRLPEALRLASNLHVAQIDSTNWAVSARGFNNVFANKLLVRIDGRTVYTPLFAGVFWDVQDTFLPDIERIEVVSGPGASLWGTNAVNGIINITTKHAADTQGLLLHAGGGSRLEDLAGLRFGGIAASHLYYRVYAKYAARDPSLNPDGSDWIDDSRALRGGFRLDWERTEIARLGLQGEVYRGDTSALESDEVETSGGHLMARWNYSISATSSLALNLYFDRTRRVRPGVDRDELETVELDFQHDLELGGRHRVVWGAGFRQQDSTYRGTLPVLAFLPPEVRRQWLSAFVQDELAFLDDRLRLTVGTKMERNDYTGWEFQPSARLAFYPGERSTLWAAISRAVRTPSRIDRELFIPAGPPFLVEGGPDFESENLLAYEAGYRIQPDSRLALDLAVFYNEYDDIRSVEPASAGIPFPLVIRNGFGASSRGAELTVDWQPIERWRLRAGYTHVDIHLHREPGSLAADPTAGAAEIADPERQYFLRSSLDLPHGIEIDAFFRRVGHIVEGNVPAYSELDVRLAWRPTEKLELSLIGSNLLHARHPEFGALPTWHEMSRAVYGKVLWAY